MGRWPELVPDAEGRSWHEGDLQGLQRPVKAWREEREDLGKQNQIITCECKNGFKRQVEFQVNVIHTDRERGWTPVKNSVRPFP